MKKLLITCMLITVCVCARAQTWDSVQKGTNGTVYALTIYNGNLIVGGGFTLAGGAPANCIAQWNGSSWTPLGKGVNGAVRSLAVYNGMLYAGGDFDSASGFPANGIAMWNGTSWRTVGAGVNGGVYVMTVYNSDLYVGGAFDDAGGLPVINLAIWNGSSWSGTGNNVTKSGYWTYDGQVSSMAIYNGSLYIGGYFDSIGSQSYNNIAAWNGTVWSAVGGGIDLDAESGIAVYAMQVWNGNLYVGGTFDTAGAKPISAIAEWNGSSWSAVGPSTVPYEDVDCMAIYDNDLYVGGFLDSIGHTGVHNVARWNGTTWSPLGKGIGDLYDSDQVYCMLPYQGELYVGGYFREADSIAAGAIATWSYPVGIDEITQTDFIKVFPNPSTGVFTIQLANSQRSAWADYIEVYNILGEKVYSQYFKPDSDIHINMSNQPSGIYVYRLLSKSGEPLATGKLVKAE